jgi:hypothetical protein
MKRTYVSCAPACPTLFTPLQLHARELLRLAVGNWVGWMRDHTVSLQRMIEEHSASVVVAGASLRYKAPFLFPDGDSVEMETSSVLHKKGVLIEGVSAFTSGGVEIAEANVYFRPVSIGDEQSAAATSTRLAPELQALFVDKERSLTPTSRAAKKLLPEIESEGVLITQSQKPFKLYRYAMDFADQWAFMEASAFASASREELVVAQAGTHAELLAGIASPLRGYHIDLKKPFFLFDEGTVVTKAYRRSNDLYFIHHLSSGPQGAEQLHAVIIEEFNA